MSRPRRASTRGSGGSPWGNPGQHRVLQGGVAELKIDYGSGYRVYYTQRGEELVILLCGGDKRTQTHDIERAISMAGEV